jgi:3-oxoacyl-[acyl-carrier-protein] synthase-1
LPDVFVVSDHIVSPLGNGTAENFRQLATGVSGIARQEAGTLSARPFYASLMDTSLAGPALTGGGFTAFGERWGGEGRHASSGTTVPSFSQPAGLFTRFELLLLEATHGALRGSGIDPGDPGTILIVSTTKGNIQLLETAPCSPALKERISLHTSARLVGERLGFAARPIVVSNACISGLLAIITGARLLRAGRYKHAVIAGADVISRFILSGFESFQAVSPEPCKPFDVNRTGISLGEGAGAMVLSVVPAAGPAPTAYPAGPGAGHSSASRLTPIRVLGGASGNDANHISGPSRTGKELAHVITGALGESLLEGRPIDFISAHGTATPYNDEMEAKAITLAGLGSVPVHSLKGYYGHTFGAAGLIESIISIQSLREDCLIPSKGFEQLGVSEPINVIQSLVRTPLNLCLKTASGFGGCNAAVVFGKSGTV